MFVFRCAKLMVQEFTCPCVLLQQPRARACVNKSLLFDGERGDLTCKCCLLITWSSCSFFFYQLLTFIKDCWAQGIPTVYEHLFISDFLTIKNLLSVKHKKKASQKSSKEIESTSTTQKCCSPLRHSKTSPKKDLVQTDLIKQHFVKYFKRNTCLNMQKQKKIRFLLENCLFNIYISFQSSLKWYKNVNVTINFSKYWIFKGLKSLK